MLLLLIFVILCILQRLIFKVCSMRLNHQTGPIFIASWVLIGLVVTWPIFGDLFTKEVGKLFVQPYLLLLIAGKGMLLWVLFHDQLSLAEKSLSAQSYYAPTGLGAVAVCNSFLGEELSALQWTSALGLCFLGIVFSFHGHLQELGTREKRLYFKLIFVMILSAVLDQAILIQTNWFILLMLSSAILLVFCLFKTRDREVWKNAIFNKLAILTGAVFAARELLKFYMMVSIYPMSVVLSAQVAAIPIVLILSSVIWKERTWQEQLLWGTGSLIFFSLLGFE